MRANSSFLVRSIQEQPLGAIAAAQAIMAAGLAYSDIIKIKSTFAEPGWLNNESFQILIVAIGIVTFAFVYVFSRQATKEKKVTEHIRQLRSQPYSTFGEIALAFSESGSGYSKQDILDRLMKAAVAGEFSERTGHSRMRLTLLDAQSTPAPERPIIKLSDLSVCGNPAGGERRSPGAIIYMAILLRRPLGKVNIDPNELLTLERSDFRRWHRRFWNGRYEHSRQ